MTKGTIARKIFECVLSKDKSAKKVSQRGLKVLGLTVHPVTVSPQRKAREETFVLFFSPGALCMCVCVQSEWPLRLGWAVSSDDSYRQPCLMGHMWNFHYIVKSNSHTCMQHHPHDKDEWGDMVSWGWAKSQLPQDLLLSTTTHKGYCLHEFSQQKIASIFPKYKEKREATFTVSYVRKRWSPCSSITRLLQDKMWHV